MIAKEDEAYFTYKDGNKDDIYKIITVSFDAIADILAKMNRYVVDYDNKEGEKND